MNISASYYSEIGGREKNEDAVTLLESGESVLGIVADGLGGYADGEVASRTALKTINAHVAHRPVSPSTLREAIVLANDAVLRESGGCGMKTTVAALWLEAKNALVATVGDTRVYQFRDGKIRYQSTDHTAAQMAVYAGDITAEELRHNRDRHKLTRALGTRDEVRPDVATLEAAPGDAFLLCSDGFWEKVREDDMLRYLGRSDSAGMWLQQMRECVKRQETASSDNHSALVIWMKQGG